MNKHFKPNLLAIERKRTSVGRDIENGLRLDRNERVTNFSDKEISEIYSSLPKYIFNVYPDTDKIYAKLSKSLGVDENKLYITNAITEGIRIVFETLVCPGDEVLIISPTYPMYNIYARIYQAKLREVLFSDKLTVDFDKLVSSINKDTCLLLLPNPNLPIENYFTLAQLRVLSGACKKYDTMLVIDEAYMYFGSESAISLIDEFDNIIILRTFSKAFGLAGIRLGYMVSTAENIAYLSKTRSLVESNGISMAVGEYLLEHPEIVKRYCKQVNEGGELLRGRLAQLGFKFSGGEKTNGMLIFLESKQETEDVIEFLKRRKIYVRGSFDPPITNCIRITLGPVECMEKFLNGFKDWLKTRNKCAVIQ